MKSRASLTIALLAAAALPADVGPGEIVLLGVVERPRAVDVTLGGVGLHLDAFVAILDALRMLADPSPLDAWLGVAAR